MDGDEQLTSSCKHYYARQIYFLLWGTLRMQLKNLDLEKHSGIEMQLAVTVQQYFSI
jgi:hypothetical protein